MKTPLTIGLAAALAAGAACGSENTARSAHGFVVRHVMASGSVLYLGGTFREPDNAAGNKLLGHEMLIVLDASQPGQPSFVAERDMKATRLFALAGGKLLGFQSGFDEETIDAAGQSPGQDVRLKVYGLGEPLRPTQERAIAIPATAGATVTSAAALDARTVLISIGTGIEPADFPLTWIVRLDAPAGSEVSGSANVACRAPVLDGSTVWCFNGLGIGTGSVVALTLDAAGAPTATAPVPVAAFILPVAAGLVAPGGRVIVADSMAGTFRMDRDLNGAPSAIGASVDFTDSVGVVPAGTGQVIVQTASALHLLDTPGLTLASMLAQPGQPYETYAGGSSVVRLDAAAGASAALDGLFAAALGDYGVLLVRLAGQTLEVAGGYYRHFGTDLVNEDNIREGHY